MCHSLQNWTSGSHNAPEYSLCSSVRQLPCSLCVQRPLFAGKLVPGSVAKIIWQRNIHPKPPGGCRSLSWLHLFASARQPCVPLDASPCNWCCCDRRWKEIDCMFTLFVCPPVFIICCSVLPRLLLLLTPISLAARIVMRIAGHPSLHQLCHIHLCPQCPQSDFAVAAICVRLRISSASTLWSNRLHGHVVLIQLIGYKEVQRTQTTMLVLVKVMFERHRKRNNFRKNLQFSSEQWPFVPMDCTLMNNMGHNIFW